MDEQKQQTHIQTICVHGEEKHRDPFGAVVPPLYTATTFSQSEPGNPIGPFEYSRAGNPTQAVLEAKLAALEQAEKALVYASGLSAVDAVLRTLDVGDRVIVCDDVYGGTLRLCTRLHADKEFVFLDLSEPEALSSYLAKSEGSTKLIWTESLTNPLLKRIDIAKIVDIAKPYGIKVAVDNTFLTPFFEQPLTLGADLVMHSATKYLGGHSDVLMGAIMTSDRQWYDQLKFVQFAAGAVASPRDCASLIQHLQTLHVRMPVHEKNAQQLNARLNEHPAVVESLHRGSGMLAVRLKKPISDFSQLAIFQLAESLGAVESLINLPEKMTHASVPAERRQALGITDTLLRISVGLEHFDDLWSDLKSLIVQAGD